MEMEAQQRLSTSNGGYPPALAAVNGAAFAERQQVSADFRENSAPTATPSTTIAIDNTNKSSSPSSSSDREEEVDTSSTEASPLEGDTVQKADVPNAASLCKQRHSWSQPQRPEHLQTAPVNTQAFKASRD